MTPIQHRLFYERSFPTQRTQIPYLHRPTHPHHEYYIMPYGRRRSFRRRVRRRGRFSGRRSVKRRVRRSYRRRKKPLPVRNARAIRRIKADVEVKFSTEDEFPNLSGAQGAVGSGLYQALDRYGQNGKFWNNYKPGVVQKLWADQHGVATLQQTGSAIMVEPFCPGLLCTARGIASQEIDAPTNNTAGASGTRIGRDIVVKSLSVKIHCTPHHKTVGNFLVHTWLVHDERPQDSWDSPHASGSATSGVTLMPQDFREYINSGQNANPGPLWLKNTYWIRDPSFWERFKIISKKSCMLSVQKDDIMTVPVNTNAVVGLGSISAAPEQVTGSTLGAFAIDNTPGPYTAKSQCTLTHMVKSNYKVRYELGLPLVMNAPITDPLYQIPENQQIRLLVFAEPLRSEQYADTNFGVTFDYSTKLRFTDS